ncbi:hypothetical protein IW261DRAFT_1416228 [Armillaria novae-zelandiae]|uniref:CxC2-like cysteine cluster KDZ transposase-associated domain-containing protein n=1 Tax=Armillaria novae-zelandiae TaxID=153914 RepID=A0AA39UGK1_9AGAR|nr:hypothetical protein IW261DRAFT_1416228 [Armillaria novae-zelandiae]
MSGCKTVLCVFLWGPIHWLTTFKHWNGKYFDKIPLCKLGTSTLLDNYEAFICIVWEWSFICLLKQAGIRNNAGGWKAAEPASCMVDCLACLHPGVNIPVKVDPDLLDAWEDTLFVSMDANFKLERFEVSSKEKDPGLGSGLRYFVDMTSFKNHLKMFDKHILQAWSTCNDHKAAKPDKKTCARSQALAASGVGGVICMHHELKLALSMVDLQVRETYVDLALSPEWSWAISNGVAASTQEMSPGHRCEKLGSINWQKNISIDAVLNTAEYESHFKHFTKTLPSEEIAKWTMMVEAWEADREEPNPFAQTMASKSEAAMHLQLACKDAQDELVGLDGDQLFDTSLKDMVAQGVQIEASHLQACDNLGNGPLVPTYLQQLYLPSSILLMDHPCGDVLICAKACLRIGQGFDLLHTICGHLLALAKAYKDGDTTTLMQKEQLKCHKTTRDINACITQAKNYYQHVQQCLMTLSTRSGDCTWQSQLRVLEESDVHQISDNAVGAFDNEQECGLVDQWGVDLRIKWCKAHARVHCWREECKLVKADMQHVRHTLKHDAILWLSQAEKREAGINASEGAGAYARCQAAIHTAIKARFKWKW